MTDKQIIIDGENIERIKTLLFEGQREAISTKTFEAIIEALESKEQECEKWKKYGCFYLDKFMQLKQTLTEIKEVAKKSCCLQPTSTCEEYENCKECSRISDDETVQQILQKISEVE